MAATSFTPISLYYSSTASNVPTAGNLVAGELALNTADGKLFYKDSGGVVQTLATKTATTFPNVNGSTSGAVTLAAPAVAGSNTATFPAATGTVMVSGNMPAFSVTNNTGQTISSNVETVVQLQTKQFDTAGAFNNTGSTATLNGLSVPAWAFMPPIAGYYTISGTLRVNGSTSTGGTYGGFFKNGGRYRIGFITAIPVSDGQIWSTSITLYLNGTSDYVQLFGQISSVGTPSFSFNDSGSSCQFSGSMVRSA